MTVPVCHGRLCVVDPHPIVAAGVRSVVASAGMEVVAAVTDLAGALAATLLHGPDLVIAELDLPDGTGLELLHELPDVPVLFHTAIRGHHLALAAIHGGARGYLLKSGPPDALLAGIERVLAGGVALDPSLVGGSHPPVRIPTLRQRRLARLVIAGETNDRIAAELDLAVRSVEGLLTRTYAHLGIGSRAELAVVAERGRWDLLPGG